MDRIEIFRGRGLTRARRGWRWRYVAAGNNKRLGSGNESYNDQNEAMEGMRRVCGLPDPIPGQDGWTVTATRGGIDTAWRVTRRGTDDSSIIVEILE